MTDQTYTQSQIDAVMTKLRTVDRLVAQVNAVEFSDEERAIVRALFEAANQGSEVEGFDMGMGSLELFKKPDPKNLFTLGPGPNPANVFDASKPLG